MTDAGGIAGRSAAIASSMSAVGTTTITIELGGNVVFLRSRLAAASRCDAAASPI
jgi:hypothetical protein